MIGEIRIIYILLPFVHQFNQPLATVADSTYQVRVMKRKDITSTPIIAGNILSAVDRQPLEIAVIKVAKQTIYAGTAGAYRWEAPPGTYKLLARSVGYSDVLAKKIHLAKGDSLEITFYLPSGPPIIHRIPK